MVNASEAKREIMSFNTLQLLIHLENRIRTVEGAQPFLCETILGSDLAKKIQALKAASVKAPVRQQLIIQFMNHQIPHYAMIDVDIKGPNEARCVVLDASNCTDTFQGLLKKIRALFDVAHIVIGTHTMPKLQNDTNSCPIFAFDHAVTMSKIQDPYALLDPHSIVLQSPSAHKELGVVDENQEKIRLMLDMIDGPEKDDGLDFADFNRKKRDELLKNLQRLLNCYPGQPDEEEQHEHQAEQRISFWENLLPCLVWNAQSLSSIKAYIEKHTLLPSIAYAKDMSEHVAHTKKKTVIHSVEKEINSSVNITMGRYIHFMKTDEMQRISNAEFARILFGADAKVKTEFIDSVEKKWPKLVSSHFTSLREMLGKGIKKSWQATLRRVLSTPSVIDSLIEGGLLNIDAIFLDPRINVKLQINYLRECFEQGIIDSSIITSTTQTTLARVFEDQRIKSLLAQIPDMASKKIYLLQSIERSQELQLSSENIVPSAADDNEQVYSRNKRRSSFLEFDETDTTEVVRSEASAAAAACVTPTSSMGDSPSKSRRITPAGSPSTTPTKMESLSLIGFYSPLKAMGDSPSKLRKIPPCSIPPRPPFRQPSFWDISVVAHGDYDLGIKPQTQSLKPKID